MPVHDQVLDAARRLCRERGGWTFRPDEVVRALPHLNPSTVRTHIVSRCCVNAPKNHPHRWEYFKRIGRGVYEILPTHRRIAAAHRGAPARVAETAGAYGRHPAARARDTVHAVVTRDAGWYVAEFLEIAVVTQGRTLDELVTNMRDAVALHLEGGDAAALRVVAAPRIALTYEIAPRSS
jgi:predicted RNase H-like HicB family nuclease